MDHLVPERLLENVNVFFSYAKARQKVKSKVGPFIDPNTAELNLDPDYPAKCLPVLLCLYTTKARVGHSRHGSILQS